ncbi:MAG: RNA polymerase sigma factor, partial [Acidimicrobiia bacterium]
TSERSAIDRFGARPERPDGEPDVGPEWSSLIASLSPAQRAIVTLYYGEDRPVEEIASILDIAVGTVKSALAKARTRLATELEENR